MTAPYTPDPQPVGQQGTDAVISDPTATIPNIPVRPNNIGPDKGKVPWLPKYHWKNFK